MNRLKNLGLLRQETVWDVVIIGGGATGLGCAVDAASRGLKTLLVEKNDFSEGTSSRSTKLVHGGVRYLKQGNISLVLEALHERGLLIRNAPHLVHHQSFIVPVYDWWEGPFYGAGMKVYDLLAGKLGLKPSRMLTLEETIDRLPTLETEGLKGGVMYYDGQFDDSRLAVHLARTASDSGACVLNYLEVTGFEKEFGILKLVHAKDTLSGELFSISANVVINATGVFADRIMQLDDMAHKPMIQPSQGIHLVLDRSFLPGDSAIMVPQTDDGRVLFAVPWLNSVIVGTTDTQVPDVVENPKPLEEEIDFVLKHAARYLSRDPQRGDVKSMFAGLRPLVRPAGDAKTAEISRDHSLFVSESGLVTITGGKWTTYRRMAEDTIDKVLVVGGYGHRPCVTAERSIHGAGFTGDKHDARSSFGTDLYEIEKLILENPSLAEKIHPDLPYFKADLLWAIHHEMAQTTADLLARRTRSLFLDARASISAAPAVSDFLASELGKNAHWAQQQTLNFVQTANTYLP